MPRSILVFLAVIFLVVTVLGIGFLVGQNTRPSPEETPTNFFPSTALPLAAPQTSQPAPTLNQSGTLSAGAHELLQNEAAHLICRELTNHLFLNDYLEEVTTANTSGSGPFCVRVAQNGSFTAEVLPADTVIRNPPGAANPETKRLCEWALGLFQAQAMYGKYLAINPGCIVTNHGNYVLKITSN